MTLLIQVASLLTIITGSTLSKSLDVPNYLQVILSSYNAPKEAPETELLSQKIGESDDAQSMSQELETLLQLRRDFYRAYNLTYQIKDPVGRMLYRNEFGDGSGSLKGSIHFVKENGKKAAIKYTLQIEEDPTSSSEPESEPRMRNSAGGNKMAEENQSQNQKEDVQIISVSRANQKLTSTTMDDNGKVVQKEKYFYSPIVDGDFDGLQEFSPQIVEDKVMPVPALESDMKGSVVVIHMKPKSRGSDQVFKKGEGFVVDKQYELEDFGFRSGAVPQQGTDLEAGEDEKPIFVYQTSPAIRVFEMSRDTNGNYEIPEKYSNSFKQQMLEDDQIYQNIENYDGNNKQQKLEIKENYRISENDYGSMKQQRLADEEGEEPLFMTHSKPSIHVMQLSSDSGEIPAFDDGTKEKSEFADIESHDGSYRSFIV